MSCQIAMAFRPWLSPSSIVSRYGLQALAEGFCWGSCRGGFSEKGLIKSVVTPASLAGCESPESVSPHLPVLTIDDPTRLGDAPRSQTLSDMRLLFLGAHP